MPRRMYDTAASDFGGGIPRNAQAILYYADRRYANGGAARKRFPTVFKAGRFVSITAGMLVAPDVNGIDVEPGDAGAGAALPWVERSLAINVWRPLVYADQTDMRIVIPGLEARFGSLRVYAPDRPVRLLAAHPGSPHGLHICGPGTCGFPWECDGSQSWWGSIEGRGRVDYDVSLVRDDFFQADAKAIQAAANIDEHHYDRFVNGSFPYGKSGVRALNERQVVQERDRLAHHPRLHARRLAVLHDELVFLRKRVWFEAVRQHPLADGTPSWGQDWRGWRWQQLKHRTG